MFTRPICVYSNYCPYSEKFIATLANMPIVLSEFQFVCVDVDKQTKQRSPSFINLKNILQKNLNYTLKNVPTIIIENGQYILSDKEAFNWLEYKLNTINNSLPTTDINDEQEDIDMLHENQPVESEEVEISGFNPNEMGALSDIYSTFGLDVKDTCVDAKEQCFAFLDRELKIDTPDGEKVQKKDISQQKTVRFNNSVNSNVSSKMSKRGYGSEKEKEVSSKYEQLMAERSKMDETLKKERKIY